MMPSYRILCNFEKSSIFSVLFLLCFNFVATDIIALGNDNKTEEIFLDHEMGTLPVPDLVGMMVEANASDACEPISEPPFISESLLKWFVLISGDKCNIEIKIQNAIDANYNAVIIYGLFQRRGITESKDTKSVAYTNFPVVLISVKSGLQLKEKYLYQYGHGHLIIITRNMPINANNFLVPSAIVVGICFLIMLIFMMLKCVEDSRNQNQTRLSNYNLRQIPTQKYKKGDPYDSCAICLEEYSEGEKLRILPCSHAYHAKCVDPWLTNNAGTCPICKQKVLVDENSPDSDEESDTLSQAETAPLLLARNDGRQPTGGGTFCSNTHHAFLCGRLLEEETSGQSTFRDVASSVLDEQSEASEGALSCTNISSDCSDSSFATMFSFNSNCLVKETNHTENSEHGNQTDDEELLPKYSASPSVV